MTTSVVLQDGRNILLQETWISLWQSMKRRPFMISIRCRGMEDRPVCCKSAVVNESCVFFLTCPLGSLRPELMATHFQPYPRSGERKMQIKNLLNNRNQFPCSRHHFKRRRRWVGFKSSTSNRRDDQKCPSARRLRMVQEDTATPNEGATCA
ncbi:hypothetical protein TNCV_172181 [Trichonephila clavipes]|nr:hypothetical protein TNCV_172181 [Trichonephila clavipes]